MLRASHVTTHGKGCAMKLEFLMCGNHNDAFLSQAAIYRQMLDSLGGDYAAARLVLCVGGPERLGEQNPDQRDGSKHCKGRRQRGFGAKPTGKRVSYKPAGM